MSVPPIDVGEVPAVDVAFRQAGRIFDEVVAALPADAWDTPTPCEGWTVRDVVGHVIGTMEKSVALVAGQDYDRADGPGDPDAWTASFAAAQQALDGADLQRPTMGPQGTSVVADALVFPTADLAVHAWDVAHGTGQRFELPPELLAHTVNACSKVPEERLRRPGLFGPAQPVAENADDTAKVMGWLGRDTR